MSVFLTEPEVDQFHERMGGYIYGLTEALESSLVCGFLEPSENLRQDTSEGISDRDSTRHRRRNRTHRVHPLQLLRFRLALKREHCPAARAYIGGMN